MKKFLTLVMALVLFTVTFAGCTNNNKEADGKTTITIASWPSPESSAAKYELYQGYLADFEAKYPDVKVLTDEWNFDLKNYLVRAAGGDLPTVFKTSPTELDTLIGTQYIKDITANLEEHGYLDGYDEKYQHIYKRGDSAWAIVDPTSVYEIGLVCNKKIFEEAGLVDENGIPIYPQTWEELAQTAKTITDKTGKPGLAYATTNRHGGWHFMNIAWSYGVNFVEQTQDGKWKAVFNTPECVEALSLVKDLKWKYDVLQDNLLVNVNDIMRIVSTGEAAMGISQSNMILNTPEKYGADMNDLAMCRIPAGPKGRYALSSANIYVVDALATDAETEAVFNWYNMLGFGPEVNEDMITKWEEDYKVKSEIPNIVGIQPGLIWKDGERRSAQVDAMMKYKNIDEKFFADYVSAKDVNFKSDPEKMAQELYDILDSAIQKVFEDKNADVAKVVAEAAENYQKNFLDKE